MALIGTRIGAYEVTALIGAGGMGEVYRARDTRLKRDVALKILPESFARDPERLARFQREAELLASLNHPNIAAIHSFEESEGTRALVMELVEGETLADRIARGSIPIDEALPIAKQIAEALEAAHEQEIIHRDWARSGGELFYVAPSGAVMRVGVERGQSWAATPPSVVVKEGYLTSPGANPGRTYDISPDGRRFLMIKATGTDQAATLVIVPHWIEELKRLVPTN